jgi:hypothetical protein
MIYRRATLSDSESITVLNHKFYQAFIEGDKDQGFLKNEFSVQQIEVLIAAGEVVVAEDKGSVIGYYLTNSIFETETIRKRKSIVETLISKDEIPKARYVFLTQAVIDKPFMGRGVARTLLKELKGLVRHKFDYLIGYIDAENHNAKAAHLKSGWNVLTEMESGCLAVTAVRSNENEK